MAGCTQFIRCTCVSMTMTPEGGEDAGRRGRSSFMSLVCHRSAIPNRSKHGHQVTAHTVYQPFRRYKGGRPVIIQPEKRDAGWPAACSPICVYLVCRANQSRGRFLSAFLFGQDVPLCAAEDAVEKQGDALVTVTVLSHTCASKDGCAICNRRSAVLSEA